MKKEKRTRDSFDILIGLYYEETGSTNTQADASHV